MLAAQETCTRLLTVKAQACARVCSRIRAQVISGHSLEADQFGVGTVQNAKFRVEFRDFRPDQEPVPKALKEVINQARLAIEKSELEDVAIEKISERPDPERETIVNTLFHPALDCRLPPGGLA